MTDHDPDEDGTDDGDPVTQIRNIGPALERAMAEAGIHTATQLRAMGAEAAYEAMIRTGQRPHFIGFYVLVMALQGRPWNDCKGAEKAALRVTFDALVARARNAPAGDSLIERMLDEIGTGRRRLGILGASPLIRRRGMPNPP